MSGLQWGRTVTEWATDVREQVDLVLKPLGLVNVGNKVQEHSVLSTLGFLAIIFLLVSWRAREASNLHQNQSGLFQWSGVFYRVMPSGLWWFNALPYIFNFVPTLITFWGLYMGGIYTWVTVFAGYVLVPIADLLVGEDSYNATPEEEHQLLRNIWFRVLTWLYPPLYISSVIIGAYHIHKGDFSNWEVAGMAVSTGVAGGFGIGCIHEMVHRPAKFELDLARWALVFAQYPTFWIEHLWGHHKRVATDEDPASSALGEDVYTFMFKCWWGVFRSAVNIETRFLEKQGKGFFSPSNRLIKSWIASAIVAYLIYTNWGLASLVFFVAQGLVVSWHIDNANYIEHYGLRRRKTGKFDKDGEPEYERPGWFHAWNTGDRLSNWILFKIERHPDHHVNAGRPYQVLRHFKESPTMPTGYAGMFVLSWFPPLWWLIMDPLVKNAYTELDKYEAGTEQVFPKGANNISSAFKREGEGFFEEGSSVYSADFYGKDLNKERQVWDADFGKNKDVAAAVGKAHKQ